MTEIQFSKLRFPIGEFEKPTAIKAFHLENWITSIKELPNAITEITQGLSAKELNYKYRPNGWNIRQVIHHCADSHINSITRFKLALTEKRPIIKPYNESKFAQLKDYAEPIDAAIDILRGVHHKLGVLLTGLSAAQLERDYIHPEHSKVISIKETVGIYAWHSNHHLAHIRQAIEAKGKFN